MRKFTGIASIDTIERLPRLGKIALGVRVHARVELLRDWGRYKRGEVALMGGNVDALAEQGVLKIIKRGKEHPKEVDYFVFRQPDEEEDENARMPHEVYERLIARYGEQPRELDVVLPDEDPAVFFPFAYKLYGQSAGLKCKGDGRYAERVATMEPFNVPKESAQADQFREIECPGPECPYYLRGECRHIGHLMVMLPEVTVAGVFQIDTSSFHSRVGILNDLKLVRRIFGRVSNLVTREPVGDPPQRRTLLVLTREVKQTRGGGSQRNHWPMRLKLRHAASLNLAQLDAMRLPHVISLRLPAPDEKPLDLIPTTLHEPKAATGPELTCGCGNRRFMSVDIGDGWLFYCSECSGVMTDAGTVMMCECGGREFSVGDKAVFCRNCGARQRTNGRPIEEAEDGSGAAPDEDHEPEPVAPAEDVHETGEIDPSDEQSVAWDY